MTNNLEDFEQPDLESGGEPPPRGVRANLANAWRTRPLFKLLVLMTVVGAIIAVSINLFSTKPAGDMTKLATPPNINQPPGGSSSPYFVDQTKKAEDERVKNAIKTGGSALPTPLGENKSIDEMTENEKTKKDPLVELRSQIERQKQQIASMKQQQQQPAQVKPPEQFDESLAQAMQKEMSQLMGGWEPHGIKQVTVIKDTDLDKKSSISGGSGPDGTNAVPTAPSSSPTKLRPPVIAAGTVSYAQLLTEANSDVPGPILAQIVSGPLSGARAVGEFKVSQDYLVLKFSLASLKGKDYKINAIALDPDTTLGGMATEVDQRYFTRVLLPAAAGFITGFGTALSQGSSSTILNGDTTIIQQSSKGLEKGMFQGLGQAGQTLSQFFQNQANQTKPLVRVAAGTPMGLFFISTVCSGIGCSATAEDTTYLGSQASSPGMTSYSPYGSYGSSTGYGGYGTTPASNYYGQSPPGYGGQYGGSGGEGSTNVPYPNPGMSYNPNTYGSQPYPTTTPYYSGNPSTYGIGTPVINP